MKAAWLLLPVGAAAACIFPDVGIGDGTGTAGGSSTTDASSSTTTTGPGGAGTTTSSTTTSSTTSSASDGGGGSTSGGGHTATTGGDGGAGGSTTATSAASSGFCPDSECQYDNQGGANGSGGSGGGSVGSADCDGDSSVNADDCEPCNGDVFPEQDAYFVAPFAKLDGTGDSFDFNCRNGGTAKYADDTGCLNFSLGACPEAVYTEPASCGGFAELQECDPGIGCNDTGTAGEVQVGCH